MPDDDDRSTAYRDTTTTSTSNTSYRDPATATTATSRDAPVYEERDTARHHHHSTVGSKNLLDWLAILLLIVGGLNWGLVGLFGFDLVAAIFGSGTTLARAIYIAVGVAAIWGFALMRLGPTDRH